VLPPSNTQTPTQTYMDMKSQANIVPPKETNIASATESKEMEVYELLGKEFKIITLKKLGIQENAPNSLSEIRKMVHEQNEKFNNKIQSMKNSGFFFFFFFFFLVWGGF
jgi:hypothetical protein